MIRLLATGSVAVLAVVGLYVAVHNAPVRTGCNFYASCDDPTFVSTRALPMQERASAVNE